MSFAARLRHTLRHDGIDYGDYIEQLTYLLFLKMADERGIDLSKTKFTTEDGREVTVNCSWPALEEKSGTALTEHYISVLQALGKQKGLLGDIFAGALTRFTNPVNLKTLISLIDETEWTSLGVDVGASGEGGKRRQERRGAIFHAAHPDPGARAVREAGPQDSQGIHDLRPGLRHRGIFGCFLRMADGGDEGRRSRARARKADKEGDVLRPGARGAASAVGSHEPLLARS